MKLIDSSFVDNENVYNGSNISEVSCF